MIYSEASRDKARLSDRGAPAARQAALLNPGQPVTVRPLAPTRPRAERGHDQYVIDVHDLRKNFGARKVVEG